MLVWASYVTNPINAKSIFGVGDITPLLSLIVVSAFFFYIAAQEGIITIKKL